MIKCDTSILVNQLKGLKAEVETKMRTMVSLFAYQVTLTLGENTPVGDAEALDKSGDFFNANYYRLYEERSKDTRRGNLPIEVGFHAGGWKYWNTRGIPFEPVIYEVEEAAYHVRSAVKTEWNFGKTFYIGAAGPAYSFLENGGSPKAPEGIMAPTLNEIAGVYSLNLANYYNGVL